MRILTYARRSVALLAMALFTSAASTSAHAQTRPPDGSFRQITTVTTAQPAAAYAATARVAHDLCNVARRSQGMAELAFPALPSPFTLERNWQATNGRDFLLRTRRYRIETGPPSGGDDNDCGARVEWDEVTILHRGGGTTRIERGSTTPAVVDRNAFFGGVNPPRLADFPRREAVSATLSARCGRPGDAARPSAFPGGEIEDICINERPPFFHDEFGEPLPVRMNGRFAIAGSAFVVTIATVADGAFQPTTSSWNPSSYLRDGGP